MPALRHLGAGRAEGLGAGRPGAGAAAREGTAAADDPADPRGGAGDPRRRPDRGRVRRLPVRERAEGPAGVVRRGSFPPCVRWRTSSASTSTTRRCSRGPRRPCTRGRARSTSSPSASSPTGCSSWSEGVGLWLAKRWAEYLTVIATAAFLPYEVSELLKSVTVTKVGAFVINVLAVVYLLLAKRLFGLRGGRKAYERGARGGEPARRSRQPGKTATSVLARPAAARGCRTRRREAWRARHPDAASRSGGTAVPSVRDRAAGCPRGHLHARARRARPAVAPLAHRRELRRLLLPSLRPGLDLLDVGCGPGTITVDLATRVAPGRVVGLDVSADPLAEARAAAERAGRGGDVRGGRRLRARRARRLLRRRPRPPGAAAPDRPGRRAARDGAGVPARRRARRPRRRLRRRS